MGEGKDGMELYIQVRGNMCSVMKTMESKLIAMGRKRHFVSGRKFFPIQR
jgi:hypothetical protein